MKIFNNLIRIIQDNYWEIGFVEGDMHDILKSPDLPIRWVNNPFKDRWFADPFILDADEERIIVLAEEFSYKLRKGRIAKLNIDRNNFVICDYEIILELDTHLSFPFIYRVGNNIYIMPENSESGKWTVYLYDIANNSLTEKNVVSNLPLTDATIYRLNADEAFVLSTKTPNQNGSELDIYCYDPTNLSVKNIPMQTIKFKSKIARNAGEVFQVDSAYYRPAQDCNKGYGNGICIQRIVYDNGGGFSFKDIITYYSQNKDLDMGLHTFNCFKGLIVVDGHGHRFKKANAFYTFCTKIKHMIF